MNPSLVQMINSLLSVLASYVNLLFDFEIAPGVTFGSFILISLVLFVIIKVFWR